MHDVGGLRPPRPVLSGILLGLVPLALLAGCGGAPASTAETPRATEAASPHVVSHGQTVRDHVSLVDFLRKDGLMVQPVDAVRRAPLRGEGVRLRIAGPGLAGQQLVESYGYPGAEGAAELERDVTEVLGGRAPASGGEPAAAHWYRGDRLLVLYLGPDPAVERLLESALGDELYIQR